MAKHCEICNINLLDDYAFQGHISGKKHLKNAEQIDLAARSVYIYWGHNNQLVLEDFLSFLSSFGKIEWHKFGPYLEYGIFQFAESKTVQNLLKSELVYQGTKLDIKPRILNKNIPVADTEKKETVDEPNNEISFVSLKTIFEEDSGFENQLSSFLNKVALTDAEMESLYEPVCVHLNRLFRQSFPKCRTFRFGSTLTGLCFKKCDLDLFMDIGEQISSDENDKSPNAITFRKVFAEAKKLLYRKTYFYSKVIPIPRAKTPIIKFFNIPTKTSCDLSFRNSLGVHNSLLIKHYLSFDPRLKPLMMLIKYWAKHCDISTDNRGGRVTNYSLVMLFIFYLQQPDVNLVPPVKNLKNPFKPQIIEGWQVNFDRKVQHPSDNNKRSIPELLCGFFNFYANFNFKDNVICPVDGKVYTKDVFEDVDNLPESMSRYKDYIKNTENALQISIQKPMCIQDPTELNHNCTSNVSSFLLEVFQKHISTSAEVCLKALNGDCSRLLLNLFETMPEIIKSSSKKILIPIFLQNFLQTESNDSSVPANTADDGKFTLESLYDVALELVKSIFEKIFRMKVEVFTIGREQKQQKTEADSDVHTNDNEKILLQCTGDRCLWRERKIKYLAFDPSYSTIEKEAIISEQMIKKNEQNNNNKGNISLNCVFEKCQNQPKVLITLSDKESGKTFKDFAGYLKSKMPSIIEKTLIHMVQYKKRSITFDRFEEPAKD